MKIWRSLLVVLLWPAAHLDAQSLEREHAISHPLYEATLGGQGRDAVATDGENFYVVWRKGDRRLMLTRFGADGSPIDPFGKQLAEFPWVSSPAIAWNGSHFLVLWALEGSLFASPMSRDGTLFFPEGVLLATHGYPASVAWNGSHFLVTWATRDYTIAGVLLDGNGETVRSISSFGRRATSPRVATDGGDFLVAYTEETYENGEAIAVARVDRNGSLSSGPHLIETQTGRTRPEVIFHHDLYTISYGKRRDVRVVSLDRHGNVVRNPTTVATVGTTIGGSVYRSELVTHTTGLLLLYEELTWLGGIPEADPRILLYGIRLGENGSPVSSPFELSTTLEVNALPSAAWNGRQVFASWVQAHTTWWDYSVRGSLLSSDGTALQKRGVLAGLPISIAANPQSAAKVASGHGGYLASWVEYLREENRSRLMVGRLGLDGQPLDGIGYEIDELPGNWPWLSYDLAFDGNRFLLIWRAPEAMFGRFISVGTTGLELADRFLIAGGATWDLSLAFNGNVYLAAWGAQAARIDPGGFLLEWGFTINAGNERDTFALASNGREFLIIYSNYFGSGPGGTYRYRISADGKVLGSPEKISDLVFNAFSLASDGDGYALAYGRYMNCSAACQSNVYVAQLGADGTPRDSWPGIGMPSNAPINERPDITFDGEYYLVAWNGRDPAGLSASVYAARIRASGAPAIEMRAEIAETLAYSPVFIAAGSDGTALISYTRLAEEPPFHGERRGFTRSIADWESLPRRRAVRRF